MRDKFELSLEFAEEVEISFSDTKEFQDLVLKVDGETLLSANGVFENLSVDFKGEEIKIYQKKSGFIKQLIVSYRGRKVWAFPESLSKPMMSAIIFMLIIGGLGIVNTFVAFSSGGSFEMEGVIFNAFPVLIYALIILLNTFFYFLRPNPGSLIGFLGLYVVDGILIVSSLNFLGIVMRVAILVVIAGGIRDTFYYGKRRKIMMMD